MKSTEVLSSKWEEFAATHLDALIGVAQRIEELKALEERSATGTVASSAPVGMQPDTRQWPTRNNRGQAPSAALIITDAASRSQMSMTVEIDYTKLSILKLYLCQSTLMKEIQEQDSYSHMQLENTTK